MTEEQVTKAVISWLSEHEWVVLDYDFPGGGTGRRFRLAESAKRGDKNAGAFCPDIVAWKDGRFLLFENKSQDTVSDYAKQSAVKRDVTVQGQLTAADPGRDLRDVSVALAFPPPFVHEDMAMSCGIDLVLTVADDLSVSVKWERRP